jgi:polyisoprenoid-binding protein YceI
MKDETIKQLKAARLSGEAMKIFHSMKSLLAFLMLSTAPGVLGEVIAIDPAHSNIQFSIRHMLVATVEGTFKTFAGTLDKDDANFLNSRISVTVKTQSIDTDNPKRDDHLRTADFFDSAQFPDATFTSTKIEAAGDKKFRLHGDLTIHGKNRPLVFDLIEKDAGTYEASTELNRLDYGVGESSMMIGDQVKLMISVRSPVK